MSGPRPLPPGADAFLALVDEDPDDSTRRLVFADWLDEQGRPGAAGASRWMAAGNRPDQAEADPDGPAGPWTWYAHNPAVAEDWAGRGLSPHGMLPAAPPVTLDGRPGLSDYGGGVLAEWWDFDSRPDAELSLLEAWPDDHTEVPS